MPRRCIDRRWLAEKPQSPEARNTARQYARFLKQQGRTTDAQAILHQAVPEQPKSPRSPGVFRVGGAVRPPALLSKVEPEYSEDARAAKYQGTGGIYAEIGNDGYAHNLQVVRGLG